jgi:transcriptional regulator with XRE-family HTH domain
MPSRIHKLTYIREWREHRGQTLEDTASGVGDKLGGFTHASLSRIERGLQPYSQPILEALALQLDTSPASMLERNPKDDIEGRFWTLWASASPAKRKLIVEIATVVLRSSGA